MKRRSSGSVYTSEDIIVGRSPDKVIQPSGHDFCFLFYKRVVAREPAAQSCLMCSSSAAGCALFDSSNPALLCCFATSGHPATCARGARFTSRGHSIENDFKTVGLSPRTIELASADALLCHHAQEFQPSQKSERMAEPHSGYCSGAALQLVDAECAGK